MNKKHLLIFYLFISGICNAQENDAGLWMTFTVQKQLTGRMRLEFQDEARLNENISELGTNLSQVGLEYEFFKGFRTSLTYRFTQRRQLDDSYSLRHRLFIDLSYRKKFGILTFILRERLQSQVADVATGEDGFDPEYYARTKLTARFNLEKKYTPFLSTEFFYQLNNEKGNEIDNVRYSAGADYDFNKRHGVTLYYIIDREVNVTNPVTGYIIGTGYTYSF